MRGIGATKVSKGLLHRYHQFKAADGSTRVFLIKRRYLPGLLWRVSLPLLLLLAVLLRIVLLTLKPVVRVRFGRMWSQSIGTWDIPMELYLCERDAGMHPENVWDVFYHFDPDRHTLKNPPKLTTQVPNHQMDLMLSPNLNIVQPAAALDSLNRLLPRGASEFIVPLSPPLDWRDLLHRYPPHFAFSSEEEDRGLAELEAMGVEPGFKFVCFHVRDGLYAYQVRPRMVSLYGDWVEQPHRNASMSNSLLAADRLTELGYFVIRMGQWSEEPIVHENPKVIDYATKFHSDFMDPYLSARCEFFIGTNCGMTTIPIVYRTPLALVNVVPYTEIVVCGTKDIYIPKKFYSATEDRLLTFREVLSTPLLCDYTGKFTDDSKAYYDAISLEIQENSPEEIAGLTVEMEQRVRGAFHPSEEDEELQSRYLAIVRSHGRSLVPVEAPEKRRIGAHFLRTHPELLE